MRARGWGSGHLRHTPSRTRLASRVLVSRLPPLPSPCAAAVSAEATLTIFWSGHGDAGFLFLPDMNASTGLYADEFAAAIRDAKSGARSRGRSRGFAQVVVLVEACESGSMLQGQALGAGVYALTAAEAGENSYPIYCCSFFRPPSCTIDGRDISSCLGDIFAWPTRSGDPIIAFLCERRDHRRLGRLAVLDAARAFSP